MANIKKVIDSIHCCLIPKLAKNYDEAATHPEFEIRNNTLNKNIQQLQDNLNFIDINDNKATNIIPSILILYLELSSDSTWNNNITKKVAQKLNLDFQLLYDISLEKVLHKKKLWNIQNIFDICIEDLHKKLTYENFKRYPAQIEVYYLIIKKLKNYPVSIKPLQVMPISLLLMEDYIIDNKLKGVECSLFILQCMMPEDFGNGNYYEVIYRTLKKLLYERNTEIVKTTYLCLLELCRLFPSKEKSKKLDELYLSALEQINTDSNLYRKVECLDFIKSIIKLHKSSCSNRNSFKVAMNDCLDVCTESTVAEILLDKTLQCLQEWIRYCWCIWRFSSDHKMMSILLKVIYMCENKELLQNIYNVFVTLYKLCSCDEQRQVLLTIEQNENIFPENFRKKLGIIKSEILT